VSFSSDVSGAVSAIEIIDVLSESSGARWEYVCFPPFDPKRSSESAIRGVAAAEEAD
jgi:hypothetical protein